MRTSSEIETISKRATRAAGFPWGIAEEIENLNLYLRSVKGKQVHGPKEICEDNSLESAAYCPFYTGSALLDSANKVEEIGNLTFHSINFPILLIPFLNRLSEKIGKKILLRIDDVDFLLNLNKFISASKNFEGMVIESAKIVRIEVLENENSFSEKIWDELYDLSSETFVEETDRLKENAAGAGLADND